MDASQDGSSAATGGSDPWIGVRTPARRGRPLAWRIATAAFVIVASLAFTGCDFLLSAFCPTGKTSFLFGGERFQCKTSRA